MLETDPIKALTAACAYMAFYLQLPHYQNSLCAVGFGEADFADGGSDRLVDAIVASHHWDRLSFASSQLTLPPLKSA